MPSIGEVIGALQLRPRLLFAICVVSGAPLVLPGAAVEKLGFDGMLQQHRGWFGSVFTVSVAVLLAHGTAEGWGWLRGRIQEKRRLAAVEASLRALTPEEARVLSYYVDQKTRTHYFAINDGIACGLEDGGILYRASETVRRFNRVPFNLQLHAWNYLMKHPDVLAIGRQAAQAPAATSDPD